MAKSSSIEDRKVERKTLKQRARALLLSPSSYYYLASDNNNKTKAVASRAASFEMPVHRKVGFMQELQESVSTKVSTEFDLKNSTPSTLLTSNWAMEGAQHVKKHPDDINMVVLTMVTLALFACCRKFMTRVSIEKHDFDDETIKALHNAHDSSANNMASKGEQKQSLKNEPNSTADIPSQVSTGEEKIEDLPPQLIFEVATSAIETTKRDCSSAGSTTASTVFTLSTAEAKDDDNCSIDTETAGDSAKIAEVQEFERNLVEEPNLGMTNISAASLDKKGSTLKKKLDIPTKNVEESAVLGKDAQAIMGVAMKVAAAVVAVNVLVLARRR
jgi:hypothetical protein